jgi:hypothetical protein
MNDYDWRLDYGNANWDIRHRFVSSFMYDGPSPRGSNPLLRWTLGNWQVNGIFSAQSGTPFNVIIAVDQANIGRPNQRPNLLGTPTDNCVSGHLVGCINWSCLRFACAIRVRQCGRQYSLWTGTGKRRLLDLQRFPVKERAKFQLRAEMFNIFNHPNFGNPNATWNTASFEQHNPDNHRHR